MTEISKLASLEKLQQPGIIFYIARRPQEPVAGGDCSIASVRNSQGVLPRESTLALW